MALPSLALGIGLQGKPIDRAQLNYQRELGAERALARKEQEKQKRREPYIKSIMDLSKGARIPYQDVLLQKQIGDFMVTLEDNLDNANYAEISQGFYNIGNSAAKYNQDWKALQKLKVDPRYSYMGDVIENISSVSDQDALQSYLSTRAGAQGGINPDGTLAITPYKYSPVANTVQSLITQMDNNGTLFQGIDEAMVAKVGGQQFAVKGVRDNVNNQLVEAIKTTPDFYNSAQDQVYKMLVKQQALPDLNTEEGQQQFSQKVDEFIAQDVKASLDKVFNERAISKGMNISIGMGDEQQKRIMEPFDTDVIVQYGDKDMAVNSYATVNVQDMKASIPASTDMKFANGEPASVGQESVFNQIGVSYVVRNPFELKIGNETFTVPKGYVVPQEYEQAVIESGGDVEPSVLAWFKTDTNKWAYRKTDGIYQNYFMKGDKADKAAIDYIKQKQGDLRKKLDKPRKLTPKPNPNPSPSNPPKGDVNSRIESNQALKELLKKNKEANKK